MNERLEKFLAAENLSQTQFAESIGVARAGVSHLLSGRNKPSYDFIEAVMQKYPGLNMEWLILGKGKMYKDMQAAPVIDEASSLFPAEPEQEQNALQPENVPSESDNPLPVADMPANTASSTGRETLCNIRQSIVKQRNVSKVIILFDDGSFQEM